MSLTKSQASRLLELIADYGVAQVELSWKGSQDTADHEEIEKVAADADKALVTFVHELTIFDCTVSAPQNINLDEP